jgi:hypothetical protein
MAQPGGWWSQVINILSNFGKFWGYKPIDLTWGWFIIGLIPQTQNSTKTGGPNFGFNSLPIQKSRVVILVGGLLIGIILVGFHVTISWWILSSPGSNG